MFHITRKSFKLEQIQNFIAIVHTMSPRSQCLYSFANKVRFIILVSTLPFFLVCSIESIFLSTGCIITLLTYVYLFCQIPHLQGQHLFFLHSTSTLEFSPWYLLLSSSSFLDQSTASAPKVKPASITRVNSANQLWQMQCLPQ